MRFAQVSYGSVDSDAPASSACGPWLYTTEPCSFRNLPDCSSGCSDLLGIRIILISGIGKSNDILRQRNQQDPGYHAGNAVVKIWSKLLTCQHAITLRHHIPRTIEEQKQTDDSEDQTKYVTCFHKG